VAPHGRFRTAMDQVQVEMLAPMSSISAASRSRVRLSNLRSNCRRSSHRYVAGACTFPKDFAYKCAQGNGSGLLGLAFSSINTVSPTPQKTPVDNAISQKDVSQPLFTAYLGSWRDTDEADKGEVSSLYISCSSAR
jgi:hypothetical protein